MWFRKKKKKPKEKEIILPSKLKINTPVEHKKQLEEHWKNIENSTDTPYIEKEPSRIYYDPIEDTEEFKQVMFRIYDELEEKTKDFNGVGSCHQYWGIKKYLLKREGIDWKDPNDMNPHIHFD